MTDKKTKMLIVDDELDMRILLAEIFKEDFRVISVQNIEEARATLDGFYPDLALIDINLPDGSGFDLVDEIRDRNPSSKLVIISAHNGKRELEISKSKGVDGFIKKPLIAGQLKNQIANLIG